MKNSLSYLKSLVLAVLYSLSFICSFYLSIVFLLILIVNEAINGKPNESLKEDFSLFIQKVIDLPERIFSSPESKEVHWTE